MEILNRVRGEGPRRSDSHPEKLSLAAGGVDVEGLCRKLPQVGATESRRVVAGRGASGLSQEKFKK